ncbi:polyprenyl synthetase family protein [Gammaproteobacteria bacterium]|nr:polyprenyl synthetase family protein [Gammaproteobacteria bacterium]
MKNKNFIEKELLLVKNLIKDEIIEERSIKELYRYIFQSDGKRLRAKLSLLSSSKNKRIYKKRIELAAVIELLHTATLVHDDVVDNSSKRRGITSVNKVWSNAHGVLIGDYIYSKAFMLMVKIGRQDILSELANATNDISKGELIQLDALNNTRIKLNDLENISYFKTGRLFEAAAKSGALLANSDNHFKKNISECAKNLGILFQIKDDLLDYSTHSKKLGKPIFQDLREGKVTYPFYFAYKKASKAEKLNLESFLGKSNLNKKVAYELIEKLGGIKKTELLAATYFKKATQKANLIKDEYIKQEMLKLIILALNREK